MSEPANVRLGRDVPAHGHHDLITLAKPRFRVLWTWTEPWSDGSLAVLGVVLDAEQPGGVLHTAPWKSWPRARTGTSTSS
ncbi:hypothetical protein [Streptomyces graminofaciens]|uniref:hypothetical protein n=1 Tax=Streptomyces graminofaciens TaxID=68212 RepID=UPI0025738697|nr:hypothetical protein [Streptomyces graminofaciens]